MMACTCILQLSLSRDAGGDDDDNSNEAGVLSLVGSYVKLE